jgi:hypothetical protein
MVVNFAVDDLSDLILELAITFDGWGRGLNVVWKGVRVSGFKEAHMEHIMNLVHGMRETEVVCVSWDLLSDGEGAKFLVVQFLQWLLHFDVASVKPHLVAHVEHREGRLHTSCLLFILVSHDCQLVTNVIVDVAKVECSLVSLHGWNCLDVNLEIGVKPLICEEQGDVHSGVHGIVVCKLCEREERHPVVLYVVHIDSQVLLEYLVEDSVWPSVSGWYAVERLSLMLRHFVRDFQKLERKSEPWSETMSTGVLCFMMTQVMMRCKTFGSEHCDSGNEEAHLCKSIHNDEDGVRGRGEGETSDEVHWDGVPRMLRDGEGFKGTIHSMVQWFGVSIQCRILHMTWLLSLVLANSISLWWGKWFCACLGGQQGGGHAMHEG